MKLKRGMREGMYLLIHSLTTLPPWETYAGKSMVMLHYLHRDSAQALRGVLQSPENRPKFGLKVT